MRVNDSCKNKIGVVTFYSKNYGSALQCFATQKYLESHNYTVDIVCNAPSIFKLESILQFGMDNMIAIIKHPIHWKKIVKKLKLQLSGKSSLAKASEREIERFAHIYLNRRFFNNAELRKIARTDEYQYFFSGSDQVWSASRYLENYYYFLEFAPNDKKVAWAPSFGSSFVADYNQRDFKKYISSFYCLSAREQNGVELIDNLTSRKATLLADPVMLLSEEQWRIESKNSTLKISEKYVLVFFLDQLSDETINIINEYKRAKRCQIITFGYHYDNLTDSTPIDGNPFDFLYLIDNADMILTDSFHAMTFSVIFHKQFFVFERQYQSGANQSIRITDYLERVGMQDRFCPENINEAPIKFNLAETNQKQIQEKYEYYIKSLTIKETGANSIFKTPCRNISKCTGCGMCVEICPRNAVKLDRFAKNSFPIIEEKLCVDCKLCSVRCPQNNKSVEIKNDKKAYLGYTQDVEDAFGSSSGGVFLALAKKVISQNGVVVGAAIVSKKDNTLCCEHVCAKTMQELARIQGSKYVQSNASNVFREVKEYLDSGITVLFSGTSCQIDGLRSYLNKKYKNLITVDLVCHGTPEPAFLNNYIRFLEKKYKCKITDISFRSKDPFVSRRFDDYFIQIKAISNENGKSFEKMITREKSAYLKMFMGNANYRESCYQCKYASVNKPADITLGDFNITETELEAIDHMHTISYKRKKSLIIVHSSNGEKCINELALVKIAVDLELAEKTHDQLSYPSFPPIRSEVMTELYSEYGFEGIQRQLDKHNKWMWLPISLIKIIKK